MLGILLSSGCEGDDLIDTCKMFKEEFNERSFVYVDLSALRIREYRVWFSFIKDIFGCEDHSLVQVEYERWLFCRPMIRNFHWVLRLVLL